MKTREIVLSALFIALGVILPQAFHVFGQQTSQMLLPMHIPVLIAGLFLGPVSGLIIGLVTPFLSFLLTGMPPMPMTVFMMFELSAYGGVAGLLAKKFNLNIYAALIIAQVLGRVVYAVVLIIAGSLFGIQAPKAITIIASTVSATPGIVLQLIFVPLCVIALRKWEKTW